MGSIPRTFIASISSRIVREPRSAQIAVDPAPVAATAPAARASQASADPAQAAKQGTTYKQDDLIGAAEGVFGKGAQGLAQMIQDLLKKQAKAPRLWTTFVALPQEEKQTFSQVLATMLRVALLAVWPLRPTCSMYFRQLWRFPAMMAGPRKTQKK